MKIEPVIADGVIVGERHRAVDPAKVKELAESIRRLGLLQPITVYTEDNASVYLVAGLHRLEAVKFLGWDEIDAIFITGDEIDRKMMEIAENLHRNDLTVLEQSEHIVIWTELERLKKGVQLAPPSGGEQPNEQGIKKTARKLGIQKTKVMRGQRIGALSAEAKETARADGLDNNQTALLAAAKEKTADAQVAALKKHVAPLSEVEAREKWLSAGMSWWNKGSMEWREEFMTRVDTPVMDQTSLVEQDNDIPGFLRRH